MNRPIESREGFVSEENSLIGKDLEHIANSNGLIGGVLLTITEERIGAVACGLGPMKDFMDRLAKILLAKIDDGEFDEAFEQ